MIGYLDSSVLLRILLNQPGRLAQFSQLERPIASRLLKAECLRTLDRLRCQSFLDEAEYIQAVDEFYSGLDSVELVVISDAVLDRCAGSFAVPLGTLDAIHLVSALIWKEQ